MEYIIYLAAGNSKRFGTNKLLYEYNGRRLFEYGLDAIIEACRRTKDIAESGTGDNVCNEPDAGIKSSCEGTAENTEPSVKRTCLVVTQYEDVAEYAWEHGIRAIYSKESADGISFSIKNGLRAVKIEDNDRIMFVVADQPGLTASTIDKMFMASYNPDFETASVCCNGQPGNPTCFLGSLLGELMALEGDEGGRKVIKKHRCIFVEAYESELKDIDVMPEEAD